MRLTDSSASLRLLAPLLLLTACDAAKVSLGDDTGGGSSQDSADTSDTSTGDSETADSVDTSETGETDTGGGETGDTGTTASVSDLEAHIHDGMGSIIELTWTQEGTAEVWAEYSFEGGEWLQTPTYTTASGARRLVLLGVPFGEEVTWRLLVDGVAAAADASIANEDLPRGFPTGVHMTGDPNATDPDAPYILTSFASSGGGGSQAWTFLFDREGRVLWANPSPSQRTTFMPMLSVDGATFLTDYNSWWGAFDGGVNSQVVRMDIEGRTIETYDTPGLIHPFTETGDGALVWGASQSGGSGGESLAILEPGGSPRTLLDCNNFVRAYGEGSCGSNALDWDPLSNHVFFSLFSAETILEVDEGGTPVRWFGHMEDSYTFADRETTFYWQHGGEILADGHLIVSSRVDASTEETVVREYEIDSANQELVQTWTFGQGEDVWAYVQGEARRMPNGNTLHNFGYNPRVREITPDGRVVWDMEWDGAGTIGRMSPISNLYAFWGDVP